MTVPSGLKSTYDLNVGVKLNIEDAIYILNPYDVPLQSSADGNGRSALATDTIFEKQISWLDEDLLTQRSAVLGTGIANTTDPVTFGVTTGDGLKFSVGDVLLLQNEYVRVTAVSTDNLTVTRGYGGSTPASHATLTTVVGVGQTLPEGSDPEAPRAKDRNLRSNVTEIFGPWSIITSGTEDAVQKYGLQSTEFDHQVANRMKEMLVTLEQTILYGIYNEDTSNKLRSMGGLAYYITAANGATIDGSTTTLTESALLDVLQGSYDLGGNIDRLVTGSKGKRVISNFQQGQIRYAVSDDSRGQVVDFYDSDFGRQMVVLDRWCRVSDLFAFERDQVELVTLRPMQFEMLAKTGDSTKGQVVAEKSLKVRRARHAARFTALT